MITLAEQINRRSGRMEALASDLAGLPPGYTPTDLELMRARELYAALARVFGPVPETQKADKPEPCAGKTGKK